jgi:hypothetical protein
MADNESGLKWWMRYVIVPIIGGGGVIAVVVAVMEKPGVPPSISDHGSVTDKAPFKEPEKPEQPPVLTNKPPENMEFLALSGTVGADGHREILAPGGKRRAHRGEQVIIEWFVEPHQTGLTFVIKEPGKNFRQPAEDKGEVRRTVTVGGLYSLETVDGTLATLELNVE